MFENATKEDFVMVLHEMGETVDSDQGILELRQKLLLCKAYLDEEFICDFLNTVIEDRMEKEEYRKREEHCLQQKQELGLVRREARRKTENKTRIREARHKGMEARLRAEEEARQKAEEEKWKKKEQKNSFGRRDGIGERKM
ncbi:hypothetical protein TNCV_3475061 [Trichonephila clavipes]|nr:hypothetical protein TNCV_3475061 [Trichonephila clavipes]